MCTCYQYVIDEWIANSTDPEAFRLTDMVVPDSCGGGKPGTGSNKPKVAEEVGGIVGGLLLLGAIIGCVVVFRKRRKTVGGLNTKFMTTARQNRGAL